MPKLPICVQFGMAGHKRNQGIKTDTGLILVDIREHQLKIIISTSSRIVKLLVFIMYKKKLHYLWNH